MRMTQAAVLFAVKKEIERAIPKAKHYEGRIEEGFSRPAFLYIPIYRGERRISKYTTKRIFEVQVVYFGKTDGYGREDMTDRKNVLEALDGFLSRMYLEVEGRCPLFEQEIKIIDEHLSFYLTLTLYDEASDRWTEEENRTDTAESMDTELEVSGK